MFNFTFTPRAALRNGCCRPHRTVTGTLRGAAGADTPHPGQRAEHRPTEAHSQHLTASPWGRLTQRRRCGRTFPNSPGRAKADVWTQGRPDPPLPLAPTSHLKSENRRSNAIQNKCTFNGLEVCLLGWELVNMPPSPAQPCKGKGRSLSPTCKHRSQPGARIHMRSGHPEPLGRACSQAVTPSWAAPGRTLSPSLITSRALGQSGLG